MDCWNAMGDDAGFDPKDRPQAPAGTCQGKNGRVKKGSGGAGAASKGNADGKLKHLHLPPTAKENLPPGMWSRTYACPVKYAAGKRRGNRLR